MIKPQRLKQGDKIAIVSLSSGLIGEEKFIHKLAIAKQRLQDDFGLIVTTTPNALKGINFLYEHPKLRAKDLMEAFKDKSIKAIICAIGGADTIRILPFIDFEVIKNNPKIFMGYSDTTVNHFMLRKAGINSFYGGAVMTQFAEYTKMFDYTFDAIKNMLFKVNTNYQIKPAGVVCNEFLPWGEENINKQRKLQDDPKGYELLQGKGKWQGEFFGGCIESMITINGTSLWLSKQEWKDKILCIETSEEMITPSMLELFLRNFAAQGMFDVISAIIVGKPEEEKYYEEYKEIYKKVIGGECNKKDLPILYNVNFGHGHPTGLIPFGCRAEIDCDKKTITLLESTVE